VEILLISPTQSGIGGIAQHVQGLSHYLKNEGHNVEIMSSENTFTIPIKGLKNPSFMISSYLKSKFKKSFDIVHAHNIPSALAMKNISGKKILTLHGIYSEQIDQLHGTTSGNVSEKYEKNAISWADLTTVISKEAFDYYSKKGFQTIKIPNAINIEQLNKLEDRRYQKQIIFAGRLSKEKGIDSLIKIGLNLPDHIHLLVVGIGPEEENIKKLVEKKNNIHFLGFQSRENTVSLIRGSDILLAPSLMEGISTTILEGMVCKTAIIASDLGGNKELIQNNISGFLLDPLIPSQFIQNILQLFSNFELKKSLTEKAFESVQNYDWKKIGKKYLNLYNSMLTT